MNSSSSAHKVGSVKTKESQMVFFDPILIKAARNIYRNYYSLAVPSDDTPMGIVVNRDSHRGQLVFKRKPILLPRECFIPLQQIEAEGY